MPLLPFYLCNISVMICRTDSLCCLNNKAATIFRHNEATEETADFFGVYDLILSYLIFEVSS